MTGSDLKYELSNGIDNCKLCYNGEKLAVARYADADWSYRFYSEHSTNILLAVYDSDGLAYYGRLNSSLDGEETVSGEPNKYRQRAKTLRTEPLELSW